jgi:hypothetical protein
MSFGKSVLCFLSISFLTLSTCCLAARPGSETYKQNQHGLEKQFEPFLKAYSKGDLQGQDKAFVVFQFPDAKAWFGQYFQADRVEQLVWDGEAEVDSKKNVLRRMMTIVERGSRFRARCKPHSDTGTGSVRPRQSSVSPLKPVPIEQFDIEIESERTGKKFSFLGNYVYVDGAYRYVGKGAYPFWSMPDANDPNKKQ